jgi:hypothetical protein
MTKEQARKKIKELLAEYREKEKKIEEEAKARGEWQEYGLDGNTHLFLELSREGDRKIAEIIREIDRE